MDRHYRLSVNGPVDSIFTDIIDVTLNASELELIRISITTATGIIADEPTRRQLIESLEKLRIVLKATLNDSGTSQ